MNRISAGAAAMLEGENAWRRFCSETSGPKIVEGLEIVGKLQLKGFACDEIEFLNCRIDHLDFSESAFSRLRIKQCRILELNLVQRSRVDFLVVQDTSVSVGLYCALNNAGGVKWKNVRIGRLDFTPSPGEGEAIPGNLINLRCEAFAIEDCVSKNILKLSGSLGGLYIERSNLINGLNLSRAHVQRTRIENSVVGFEANLKNFRSQEALHCENSKFFSFDFTATSEDARETGEIHVLNCNFINGANFNNRRFGGRCSFRNSVFKRAPRFHNCDVHQDTDFSGSQFLDLKSVGAERAYRSLKLAMNKHHAHAEEMMFFGLEMRARRQKERWHSAWLYWLYEKLSDYGQSIVRPLAAILGSFAFFLTAYWFVLFDGRLEQIAAVDGMRRIGELYLFTLNHTLPFLRPFLEARKSLPWPPGVEQPALVSVLVGVQTTIALVLFFLLLLALRNRFRLKS